MAAADVDSDSEGFQTGFNQSDQLSALFETSSMVASSARYGFRIVSYLSATRTCLVPPPVCQIVRLARETGHRSHARTYSHPPARAASQKHPTQVNKTVRRDGEYRFYPYFLALEGSICWFETTVVGVGVEKPFETVDVGLFGWMRLEWFFSFWCPLM